MLKRNREHPFQRMDVLGMRPRTWRRTLARVPRPVDRGFEHRVLGGLMVAAANAVGARLRRLNGQALPNPSGIEVTFIIGHWRSGTTFLHHLLAANPRFGTLPTSMAIFPDLYGTPLLMPVLTALGIGKPYRRLIDNVMLTPDSPMELEFAVLNLTGLSEYLSTNFPRNRRDFLKYLRASPSDCTVDEDRAWRRAVIETTARLAVDGRTVLHKNPPSTANIGELKRMFPRAQFVFLHREPLGVFRSTLRTWQRLTHGGTLQWDVDDGLEDYVIERYIRLHEAYLAQRGQISPGDLVEMRFEDLLADPLAAVGAIHRQLGWGAPDIAVHEGYLSSVERYQRGDYAVPDSELTNRVQQTWGPIRERLDGSDP